MKLPAFCLPASLALTIVAVLAVPPMTRAQAAAPTPARPAADVDAKAKAKVAPQEAKEASAKERRRLARFVKRPRQSHFWQDLKFTSFLGGFEPWAAETAPAVRAESASAASGLWSATVSPTAAYRAALAPSPEAAGGTLTVNGAYSITANDLYDTVQVSTTANGTINHSAGTLTVTNEFDLGVTAGLVGTYNLSGVGTLAVFDLFIGGFNGVGSGAFVQTGGTVTVADGVNLGSTTNASDTYSISAGALTTSYLVIGDLGPATFTQTGGSVTIQSNFLQGFQFGGMAATYQLNSGTLTIPVVYSYVANTGTFNFNGGILQANAASATFMESLLAANVQTGGAKIDTGAFDLVIAQPLLHSGAGTDGGLTKQTGAGKLTLTGANTYNGLTTISAGTLQVGNGGTTGSLGSGNVVNNASLVFNRTDTGLSVGGNISGSGSISQISTGTTTLSGTNSYAGATTVSLGRLVELNNGKAFSNSTVAISSGATVELSNTTGTPIFQAGATFNGAGTLQKTGSGRIDFGSNGGTVRIALSTGGLIDVQAGLLIGSNSNQADYTGNLGGLNVAASATFDGVEAAVRVDQLTGAGTLQGGYQSVGSTTIGVNNGSGTFSGTIKDSGSQGGTLTLIKAGTGTQTLTGGSTYTGGTTVSGGTLTVSNNGTTALGRLQGTAALVVNGGGTLLLSGSNTVTDRLNNAASVTINGGGKLSTGALSEGTAPTAAGGAGGAVGLGALTLASTSSGSRAIIDFTTTATGSALVFSSLAATSKGAFVTILGFTGAMNADSGAGGNDRLLFTSDPQFSLADLANWQFSNDAGANFAVGGRQIAYNGYYEIVPVPEPATWLGGVLLLAGAAGTIRLRTRRRLISRGADRPA